LSRRGLSTAEQERRAYLIKQGRVDELAAMTGLPRSALTSWASKHGISQGNPRPKKVTNIDRIAEITREARSHGMSYGEWLAAQRHDF
jgi:hypothetical protein